MTPNSTVGELLTKAESQFDHKWNNRIKLYFRPLTAHKSDGIVALWDEIYQKKTLNDMEFCKWKGDQIIFTNPFYIYCD